MYWKEKKGLSISTQQVMPDIMVVFFVDLDTK